MSAVTPLTTTTTEMHRIFDRQRQAFLVDMHPAYQIRKDRLDRLLRMTEQHAKAVGAAISQDFGHRAQQETELAEILLIVSAIKHARRNLKRWMKTRRAPTGMHFRPGYNRVMRQPLGVVGVVSPWNYPFQLSMIPAVAALAAGNRVMVKPSETTPRFAELFRKIVAEHFAENEFTVINGEASVGKAFVELPFDHLLFTGSTQVGRLVAQAAAKNLTPVTLELGGKSPLIIDRSANFAIAAPRIAFAKLLNAGQTCIAPDYAMVPRERTEEFLRTLQKAMNRLYPKIACNPDYTSIVSDRHYARLRALVEDAKAKGARVVEFNPANETFEPSERKFPPTLLLDVTDNMQVMQEEIFGPLLPIMTYGTLDEAIRHINVRDRPLALYFFGDDATHRDRVLNETIAGGVTINDCAWHFAQEEQPFGGVGASGMGAYHGEHGFRTFSKEKPVFYQPKRSGARLLYPPYGRVFNQMIATLKRLV